MIEEIGDIETSGGFFRKVDDITTTRDGFDVLKVVRITDDGEGTTVAGLSPYGRSEFGAGKAVGVMAEAKLRSLGLSSAKEYKKMQTKLSEMASSNSGGGAREYSIKIKNGKFIDIV